MRNLAAALVLAAWLLPGPAAAQSALDPEAGNPCPLRIVLHIPENRFLTPLFQEQVRRGLERETSRALGGLARVEVVRTHPLLAKIESQGLQPAVESWEDDAAAQTHFVLLEYRRGRYLLRGSMRDGWTGLAAPSPWTIELVDRAQVAEEAARRVVRSFAPGGTVTEVGKDSVEVTFRGGEAGEVLGRQVRPGQVLAVCRLTREATGPRSTRLPWAVLQVLDRPRDGKARCRYLHRFQEDRLQPGPGVLGYRTLVLPTVAAVPRLRLLDQDTLRPLDGLIVRMETPGKAGSRLEIASDREGLAAPNTPAEDLVQVQVLVGNQVRAQFPLPILPQRTVTCLLRVQPEAETRASLEFRRDLWLRRIYDDLQLVAERGVELNALLARSLKAALDAARQANATLEQEIDALTTEERHLAKLAEEKKLPLDLTEGQARIQDLELRRKYLGAMVGRLEEAAKGDAKDLGLKQLLERARLQEARADIDEAIDLYARVLQVSPEQERIRTHLESLKKAWALRDEAHGKARAFAYGPWGKTTPAELEKTLPAAAKILATLQARGDKFSIRRFQQANLAHAAALKKQLEDLGRLDDQESRTRAKNLVAAADGLRRLIADTAAFLSAKEE